MFTRLKRLLTISLISVLTLGLVSCSSPSVQMYSKEVPKLDLASYFDGEIDAYGIFTNRSGEVVKRFKVLIKAKWEVKDGKKVGVLDEDFVYSDGTKQKRIWTLTEVAPGRYSGTASDVIGEAVGELAGNALNWRYTLALPVDGKTYHVQFNDWMYLMDDKVMLNKAEMSKFGIYLGEVTLAFYKR
ncbi:MULTISPECIES: DUF3833 domain-containing protein [unclassified Polynucleobacter]|uniref:DUF3833 domain-containing protein n=1 Tax=unclassified Polynucleobacter TaxID=2640945 RepID=UPI002572EFC8|nr:DUF3833 domain-containing protein [Polynucleobacter sp. HIN7]BEI36014.1 DUF3833 domain-containing protein [Polynucleobacter sp. HIN6]BEI37819.1 DUF3833 domain-containing protein [Polynucleobacter sp. HIN7]